MNFKEDSFFGKGIGGNVVGNESSILSAERTALNFITKNEFCCFINK